MVISDLENKINETLEQLALVQTQLELNQNQSEIHLERLKQQLRGINFLSHSNIFSIFFLMKIIIKIN